MRIILAEEIFKTYSYGKLLQEYGSDNPTDTIYGSKCIDEQSRQKKLAPNLEYGTLLGFVAGKSDNSANKPFTNRDNKSFFMIGKQAEIEFISEANSYYVTTYQEGEPEKVRAFPAADWEKLTLYFTINDTVIKDKKEFDFLTECLEKVF